MLKPSLAAFEEAIVSDGFCSPKQLKLIQIINKTDLGMNGAQIASIIKEAELLPDVEEWIDAILGILWLGYDVAN